MRRTVSASSVVVAACTACTACAGSAGSSASPPPSRPVSATCDATNLQRRIVGEPAVDLVTFTAHAANDVVLVHYDGCRIEVLDACRDDAIHGRFGSYKAPASIRNDERFAIRDEDELRARLPFATPELASEVHRAPLDVVILTRGVAELTRDRVSRAELAPVHDCARATHFVSSFHVGAFRIGASGSPAHAGGRLEMCDVSGEGRECRVPLFVTLRALD
jgi:hypothetical protein